MAQAAAVVSVESVSKLGEKTRAISKSSTPPDGSHSRSVRRRTKNLTLKTLSLSPFL